MLRTRWHAEELPRWPFALPFVSYPACWLLGIGDFIWPIAGVIMLGILLRSRSVRIPPGWGWWLLFLAWATASTIMIDTPGRMIGAGYRLALYAAATVMALYAYNSRRTLSTRTVTGIMTVFLAVITVGGYLAIAAPLLTIRTPLSWVVPSGLASNELIGEMIIRRTTQWNPSAWVVQEPRPSAPFLYTNTWGNVYSLVLPLAVVYLAAVWREPRRWWVLALIIVSVVPAVATLNRGMFIGLGVVALWGAVQALRRGRVLEVTVGLLAIGIGVGVWSISPAGAALLFRVEETNSTEDRASLYASTIDHVLGSPLFGFGAPRPAEFPWLPSLGTQGQFWTVLFSHGFVGLILFVGFFVRSFLKGLRRTDLVASVAGGIIIATLVESFYYGMMTGLSLSLIAVVLLQRSDSALVSSPADRRSSGRRRPIGHSQPRG